MPTVYQCDVCSTIFKNYGNGYHLYHAPGENDLDAVLDETPGAAVVYSRTQTMCCSTACLTRAIGKLEDGGE